jgi:hypothetical protein
MEENIVIYTEEKPEPDVQIALNRQRYEAEPELREMADKIHRDRMLAPPACDSCICLAIALLDSKKERAM